MILASGSRLGPYEIVGLLGQGGMGDVYEARDTRLDRTVAIKVLNAKSATDRNQLARFQREAKTIAGLSHPHICALYDIGDANGTVYLVMEHVRGQTIAARLRAGALPVTEALRTAATIADALSAAHRQGIVHRDLTPGNVMLTTAGPKLLDFGLAKLAAVRSANSDVTATAPITNEGTFVGTLPYMAPEQLEGRPLDERTDIWALGAMLYEMVTGVRAFDAASSASVIASILEREPTPLTNRQPLTPVAVERLVLRCLAKAPDARWQNATDLAEELRWLAVSSEKGIGTTHSPAVDVRQSQAPESSPFAAMPSTAGARWRWLVAAAAAGALAVTWSISTMAPARSAVSAPSTLPRATARQLTSTGSIGTEQLSAATAAALSSDGRTAAFVTGGPAELARIWVRDVDADTPHKIWEGPALDLGSVSWHADGAQVLLTLANLTYTIPRFGGEPRLVPGGARGRFSSISRTGELAVAFENSRVITVTKASGQTRALEVPATVAWVTQLAWSPSGDRIAVASIEKDSQSAVWTLGSDGQEPRRLLAASEETVAVCWSSTPHALVALRWKRGTSEIVRLLDRPEAGPPETLPSDGGGRVESCSVSTDGRRLLQTRATESENLWRLDLRDPRATWTPITQGSGSLTFPSLSPDGTTVLATRDGGERQELLKIRLNDPNPVVLQEGMSGAWSPDGTHLAFLRRRNGGLRLFVGDADGNGEKELGIGTDSQPIWWSSRLVVADPDHRNFRIRDLSTGEETPLLHEHEGWVFTPRLSPNGRQVAFYWNQHAQPGMYVAQWPSRESRLLWPGYVGGVFAWSRDGVWVYMRSQTSSRLLRVRVGDGRVEPLPAVPGSPTGCDVSPATQMMVCSVLDRKTDLWLVENFDVNATIAPSTTVK